jgi:hypothetical protein
MMVKRAFKRSVEQDAHSGRFFAFTADISPALIAAVTGGFFWMTESFRAPAR